MKNAIMKHTGIISLITALLIIPLQACEKMEEMNILELSNNSITGQDGFEYVLTKHEFLTPYDLPIKELRLQYGPESEIADWNDINTNFKDDLSGFLNQIGLSDDENHESFFITKDGQYEHPMNRHFMLVGKNNPSSSELLILKTLESSCLILNTGFDTGKVLVKISADR
ncbi:hypothetical protein QYS49_32380 [Marivirga salinae]|uniref:Uncharacterized protein n=1 Tax=Marivirga salinarum TaxID=3059078 RepID=A0AA51R9C5_9BACT|nr:hypothetical protein [Marivirga sp. BDSF4-3]WMN12092.1 hypothetical protein QYS49_32380 [Marivirga sp. BDSF4-3]